MTGQFDRIADGETVESRSRFEAAPSADGPGGYPEAAGPDLATQHTFNEAGDRPILQLNDGCRIAHDGALQWVLQRSSVNRRTSARRWQGRRFHVERDPLLHSIRELCGDVDQSAAEIIKGWPPQYPPDCSGLVAITTLLPMAAE